MTRRSLLLLVAALVLAGCNPSEQSNSSTETAAASGDGATPEKVPVPTAGERLKRAEKPAARAQPAKTQEEQTKAQGEQSTSESAEDDSSAKTEEKAVEENDDEPNTPGEETETAEKPKEPTTVEEFLERAQRSIMRDRDFEAATADLEKVLELDAKNRAGLFLLAYTSQIQGIMLVQEDDKKKAVPSFLKSAKYMRQLHREFPQLNRMEAAWFPRILYQEGCAEALSDKPQEALAVLKEAVEAGFEDLEMLREDDDLAALRDLPEFKALQEQVLTKIKETTKQQIAEYESFVFDFSLADLEGKPVAKKDFAGKVLIVDIWGTWCPPCRKEIPHFVALHKKYREQGLEIVGLNYEEQGGISAEDAPKAIQDFVKEFEIPYPCILGKEDLLQQVPNFEGFPTTLFLDRTGKVRMHQVGYRPIENLETIVTMLLEEKSDSPAEDEEKPAQQ